MTWTEQDGALALQIFSAIVAGKVSQCDRCGLTRTSPQFREAVWRLMARMGLVTERVDEFLEALLEPVGEEREQMLAQIPQEEQEHIALQILCARVRHRMRDGLTIGALEDLFVGDVADSGIAEEEIRPFVRRLFNAVVQEDIDARQAIRRAKERARPALPPLLPC